MIKKIFLGLCLFVFSCTNTSNINSNQTINPSVTDKHTNIPLWNNVTYNNFSELENIFKENNNFYFQGGYNNDENIFMIFFNNTSYLIDSNLNVSSNKLIDKGGQIFLNTILDKKGNGISLHNGETVSAFSRNGIKRFENFLPKEDLEIKNKYVNLPEFISIMNGSNGKGYSIYKDGKELNIFDINTNNSLFEHYISSSFSLNTDEEFMHVIFNSINKALVFTKDKSNVFRVYNLENNNIDLNKGKILDFKFIKDSNYLVSDIDSNGNGYIKVFSNDSVELKKIENFEIKGDSHLININSHVIKLDSNGSGLIVSVKEAGIYFNEIEKFKIIKSEYITKSEYPDVSYQINSNGNGFILISRYIKTLYSDNKVTFIYDNKFILVKNYKMVNKL